MAKEQKGVRLEHITKIYKDYKTAKWPIAQAAFEFETEDELEDARSRIEELVYAVLL